jgi:transcription elongation factor Elf1
VGEAKEKIRCSKCGEDKNVILLHFPKKGGDKISVLWCQNCENVEEIKNEKNQ